MTSIVGTYWVGQIPGDPLSIQIRDDRNIAVDLSAYSQFHMVMLDSDNKKVDLTEAILDTSNVQNGRLVFSFPQTKSLFKKQGDYLLQLELAGAGKLDYTSTITLRVRKLGRR